jgi:hypothetical protein
LLLAQECTHASTLRHVLGEDGRIPAHFGNRVHVGPHNRLDYPPDGFGTLGGDHEYAIACGRHDRIVHWLHIGQYHGDTLDIRARIGVLEHSGSKVEPSRAGPNQQPLGGGQRCTAKGSAVDPPLQAFDYWHQRGDLNPKADTHDAR